MAYRKFWHYAVYGTGRFPMDMLRYDQCWPATESDSYLVQQEATSAPDDYLTRPRVVRINGISAPTVARWKSHGWRVIESMDVVTRTNSVVSASDLDSHIPPRQGRKVEA